MGIALKSNPIRLAGIAGGSLILSKVKPEWGQKFLYNNLKKFPGVPAKFSQWLEQKWDVKNEPSQPMLSVEDVRQILRQEVPDFYPLIDEISEEAWAASIGQVHRVTLTSGQVLAVKIQYPGLAEEVKAQIDQLVWMLEKSPAKRFGFDAETWRSELHQMFSEELDYRSEMQRQQRFKEMVGSDEWLLVPEVFLQWSSQRVLTQSFLPGENLEVLVHAPLQQRSFVAGSLARVLVRMLLSSPLLHGDLQPKNWAWSSEKQKIILYDFGSCINWSPYKQRLFESLIDNIKSNGDRPPLDYLVALGFDRDKLGPINSQLPALIKNMLEPFWEPRLKNLSEWQFQKMAQEILGDQGWYFRTAGPPWFLWLMRSLASVFHALRELSDRVSVGEIFAEEQRQLLSERWQGFDVPSQQDFVARIAGSRATFSQQAQFLHIRVTEGAEDVVVMRFPVHLLQNLEELMDSELLQRLQEQNLDIDAIKTKAFRSGLIKQELFSLKKAERFIRVWIA